MTLKSWLKSILQSRASAPTRKRLRRAFSRKLLTERLETRVLMAGDLDLSFGNAGIVTTNFIPVTNFPGWSDSASSVALQGDGKIVAAGTIEPNGGPEGAISRYNVNGSLDNTFSSDGKISDPEFNIINDVAIQPDGRIVVVGRAYPMNGAAGNFAIGRFNAEGSRDTTFGTNGIVITNPGVYDTAYAVALLNGGKILVTGQSGQPGPEQPYGFTLQQFNSDGTIDTTFGTAGKVRTFYSPTEVFTGYGGTGNVGARDIVVQPDGKFYVAGETFEAHSRFAVVRYNADGSLDTTFDTDGRVVTAVGSSYSAGDSYATSIALQADGKVVIGGYFNNVTSGNADFAIVRYNTDGSLDTTFDGDGKLILDYGGTHDYINDVKVQSDGSIVVTGSVGNALAVARFNPDGSPDASFGTNGLVTTAIQASASGSEVVIQPDGAIVVAGTVNNGNGNRFLNRDFVVARYNGLDPVAVSIAAANDANETGSVNGKFTISVDAASPVDTVVTYSIQASSSATAGADYATLSGTVTIPAGSTSADIIVGGIANDLSVESDETITIKLTGSTAGTSVINTASDTATVLILDNDSAVMSIGNASVTEGNSGTTVLSFPVTLSNPVDVAVSVSYATQNGTAIAGSDYVAQSGTLTIPAGSTTGSINITVNGDTAIELNETLSVVLSNVQAAGRNVTIGINAVTPGIVQLDASTLGLTSGTVVTSWGGQTAGGTPTILAGQTPNGGAAVQFNAGGDRLGDNVFVPASAAGDFIYVAVVKANNIGNYHNLVDDDASIRPMLWIDGSFNYEMNYSGGGGAKAAGTGPGGWDIVIMDSRLNQLYVNSATPNATGGGAVAFTAGRTFDFFHRDGGQTFQGLVAEARIYNNRAAFGGDFAALYNELQTKWFGSGLGSSVGVGTIVNDDFNTPPTANAGGPYTVAEGSSIVLNGSGSLDAEQSTASLTFQWDLDGDGVFGETGVGAIRGSEVGIAPTFSAAGLDESVLTVSLKVTDNAGVVSTTSTTQITVANVAPIVTVRNVTLTVNEGQLATNGGSFSDTGLDSPVISASVGNVSQTGGGSITYVGSIGGLGTPIEMAFDTAGNLFVAEDTPGAVSKFNSSGTLVTRWSVGGATTGLAVDSVGNVYVTSKALHNIKVYTNSGVFIRTIGGFGSGNGRFNQPHAITLDSAGNIYVTENGNSRVQVLDNNGNFLRKWGTFGTGNGQFNFPQGIELDSTGNLYITDRGNNRLQKFDSGGNFMTKWSVAGQTAGVGIDSADRIFVSNFSNPSVQVFTSTGVLITTFGSIGSGLGQFNLPHGVEFDKQGSIWVADWNNGRVQEFSIPNLWSWSFTTNDGNAQSQTVTITADDGGMTNNIGSTTFTLIVNNVAPTAVLGNDGAVDEGSVGGVAFSSQFDPSMVDTSAGFRYAFDFDNDGTFDSGDGTYSGSGASASAVVPASFLADGAGSRTVKGRILDKDGGYTDYLTTITINNVVPIANNDGVSTNEDTLTSGNVVTNDTDPAGANDPLTVTNAGSFLTSVGATVVLNSDGTFSYNPATSATLNALTASQSTTDNFGYLITDGDGGNASGIVTVTVAGVNDAATISGDNAGSMTEDGTSDSGIMNVSDVDNAENLFQPQTSVTGTYGSFTINAAGNWSYTRTANLQSLSAGESVADSFTVVSLDGTASRVVTISITGENDAPVMTGVASNHDDICDASANKVVTISGSFSDIDTSDMHTATVTWGDGMYSSVAVDQLANTLAGSHTYQNGGIYTVTVTVNDGKGGTATSTTTAVVQGAGVVDGTLYIIGTQGRDHVNLKFNENKNELKVDVKLNQTGGSDGGSDGGHDGGQQTFAISAINRIVAYLCDGDDQYNGGSDGGSDGGSAAAISQFVFGGAGNDNIQGGRGNDVLSGGSGKDDIKGGRGADILIGGTGKDNLQGGRGNDLIIGGSTANENDLIALDQALAEWRIDHLTAALSFIGTVTDDNEKDDLFGEDGNDYLHYGNGDKRKN